MPLLPRYKSMFEKLRAADAVNMALYKRTTITIFSDFPFCPGIPFYTTFPYYRF